MKTRFTFENLTDPERAAAEKQLNELLKAIEKRLEKVHPELRRLDGHVERLRKGKRVHASLRLFLPFGTLVAKREDHGDVKTIVDAVCDDLVRQIERRLSDVRHEQEFRRKERRARLEEMQRPPRDAVEAERRKLFWELIEPHLEKVWNYAARELGYLEASGALPVGALSLQDTVDAILLEGLKRFEKKPTEFSADEWLYQLAVETLERESRKLARARPRDALSLEALPPEPAEEPTEKDSEFWEFYQPDDAPRLEDLVPYPEAETPEEEVVRRETELALHRALAALPQRWRHALMLVHAEEVDPERAAEILGMSKGALEQMLERARDVLRARLADELGEEEAEARTVAEALTEGLAGASRFVIHHEVRVRIARNLGVELE